MDFTKKLYITFLKTLIEKQYSFHAVTDPLIEKEKSILLRHDVDSLPLNSLEFARIQSSFGIRATYYFRCVPESWDELVIEEVFRLGHEIGYHYEDISLVANKQTLGDKRTIRKMFGRLALKLNGSTEIEKKLADAAIESFSANLEKFRKIVPIRTICMHGSPLSMWDNRLLWKYYDYRNFGIDFEPYFDVNMENVLYLTDTGRKWNGQKVSLRDKFKERYIHDSDNHSIEWKVKAVEGSLTNMSQKSINFQRKYEFHSTNDIIQAAIIDILPEKIMMTFHPQRWTDKSVPWVKELIWQNLKNSVKYLLINFNDLKIW